MNTDNTCSGKFVAGACPGPSTIQVGAPHVLSLDYFVLKTWLVLHGGEMQHLAGQRRLSIGVELLQWLIHCWRLSWSQQFTGTESVSSNAEELGGLANYALMMAAWYSAV